MCMFPSILTLDFDLFGVIFDFLGHNGIFVGLVWSSISVMGSTHVVEQLSFSIILSILSI